MAVLSEATWGHGDNTWQANRTISVKSELKIFTNKMYLLLRVSAVYSLVDKVQQGLFLLCQRKKNNKMFLLFNVGGIYAHFEKENSSYFWHVGEKKDKLSIFSLSGTISPCQEDLFDQTIYMSGMSISCVRRPFQQACMYCWCPNRC